MKKIVCILNECKFQNASILNCFYLTYIFIIVDYQIKIG